MRQQQTHNNIGRYNNEPLSNDQLMRMAPSVFASEAYNKMSDRYAFIPTIQVVEKMRGEGFLPFSATQSHTRIEGKEGFTKHVIRFRDARQDTAPATRVLGTIYPELVLTNAHDGGSAYKIDAGLFRLVCLNGMVVADSDISQVNVRHSGSVDGIIDASYEVIEQFPKVIDSVERFASLQLTAPQQTAYADAAIALRYDENENVPVTPDQILQPRRAQDTGDSLWNKFNVVSENLLRGGVPGVNAKGRRLRTRRVSGVSENARLNKALWQLTEHMRALVSAV